MKNLLNFGFKKLRFKKLSTNSKIRENKTQETLIGGVYRCRISGEDFASMQRHNKNCTYKYCKSWDFKNHCSKKDSEKNIYGV